MCGKTYEKKENGKWVRWWYDYSVKSWCVVSLDADDNQIGSATYTYSNPEALKNVKGRLK